ncbi:uncharacterized protein LOC118434714 [Folsomia candida]|uniref:uncharacterized protein LOC118434714 n=1 Tax=Folsomia candida TaxID=158441 RepID=UPI001604A423|nr:uncharacterized protein LOC118434714 [Folsomia candida]
MMWSLLSSFATSMSKHDDDDNDDGRSGCNQKSPLKEREENQPFLAVLVLVGELLCHSRISHWPELNQSDRHPSQKWINNMQETLIILSYLGSVHSLDLESQNP